MIRFRNWILTGELDARQYDDYTAEFRVVGLPLGWVKWELFWNFGSHLDVFNLSMDESGTAGTVLFDKNNLAFSGIYRAQLRATNAAGGEKYTDTLELDIKPSFSEDANWPEIPKAFQDYVDTIADQLSSGGNGKSNVFIGTELTPFADYKSAFDSGKACFMLRDRGGSKVMYTICQVTSRVVHLARTASSGLVEFGALSSSGTLSFQTVSYATEITAANTAEDDYVPTAKAVKTAIAEKATAIEHWVMDQSFAQMDDLPTAPADIGAQPAGDYALKSDIPSIPVQSVNGKTGAVKLAASDVGARPDNWFPTPLQIGALPSSYTPPNQTAEQVGADPKGTAATVVGEHNVDTEAHNDLREELKSLSDRLNAFFDSDDTTLDELSEIVAYITSNKTLIEAITTSKVNVTDIVNNLTTNVIDKPLSAAQGIVLKGLIDTLSNNLANYQPKGNYALRDEIPTVPTNVSAFVNDSGYLTQHQDISGKLDASKLPDAINTALAQAKASGEFDGKNGSSVTVSSVTESTTDGGSNVVAFSDGKTVTIKNGSKGSKGDPYTLTASDKSSIAAAVKQSLTTETWVFKLKDGSTVTKEVYIG